MSQYTHDEVMAMADEVAAFRRSPKTDVTLAPRIELMLRAYAATLRQQAARVDGGMVERFKAAFAEHSTISPGYDECIRAALEAALSAQPAPERQGEAVGYTQMTVGGYAVATLCAHALNLPDGTKLYTHPAAPVGVPEIRVDKQGVRFGDGCWYSHERITGVGADLLNEGKCSITAREYMKWVQKQLAAAPSAPQGTQQGEG